MKATFEDFLVENQNCSGLTDNEDAQRVFDIISKDENIIKMIEFSDLGQPALAACVVEIEEYCRDNEEGNFLDSILNESDFNKKAVGNMVKTVLAPFGYEVAGRKKIGQNIGSEFFSTAACYKKTGNARLKVKKIIVPIED